MMMRQVYVGRVSGGKAAGVQNSGELNDIQQREMNISTVMCEFGASTWRSRIFGLSVSPAPRSKPRAAVKANNGNEAIFQPLRASDLKMPVRYRR